MATATKTEAVTKLKLPDTYSLVCYDDDTTSVEVVLEMLQIVLGHDENTAVELVIEIQTEGKTLVKSRLSKLLAEDYRLQCQRYVDNHQDTRTQFKIEIEKDFNH